MAWMMDTVIVCDKSPMIVAYPVAHALLGCHSVIQGTATAQAGHFGNE